MNHRQGSSSPQPVFREFHDLTVKTRRDIPPHRHLDYELLHAVSGHYCCTLNGEAFQLRPGEAILVKPGDTHSDHFTRVPVRYQALSFYVELTDSGHAFQVFAPQVLPRQQRPDAEPGLFGSLLGRLCRECRQPDACSRPLIRALMAEVFWSLVRSLPKNALAEELLPDEPEAERFRGALHQLFAEAIHRGSLPVDELAGHLHVSRRKLTRQCRNFLGISPARAFLRYKLVRATELLRQTDMTCQEISAFLGFANPYHFSTVFKRTFDLSPQSYRGGVDPHGPRLTPLSNCD